MTKLARTVEQLETSTNPDIRTIYDAFKRKIAPESSIVAMMERVMGTSDLFYIPFGKKEAFRTIAQVFLNHSVMCEIAIPRIGAIIGWQDFYMKKKFDIPHVELWGGDRYAWPQHYNSSHVFLHPMKFIQLNTDLRKRKCLCSTFISDFFSSLQIKT